MGKVKEVCLRKVKYIPNVVKFKKKRDTSLVPSRHPTSSVEIIRVIIAPVADTSEVQTIALLAPGSGKAEKDLMFHSGAGRMQVNLR